MCVYHSRTWRRWLLELLVLFCAPKAYFNQRISTSELMWVAECQMQVFRFCLFLVRVIVAWHRAIVRNYCSTRRQKHLKKTASGFVRPRSEHERRMSPELSFSAIGGRPFTHRPRVSPKSNSSWSGIAGRYMYGWGSRNQASPRDQLNRWLAQRMTKKGSKLLIQKRIKKTKQTNMVPPLKAAMSWVISECS